MRRSLGVGFAALLVSLFFAAPALAAAPVAMTGSASNVWSDTAVLNGSVSTGGETLTSCEFTYGPDPSLMFGTSTSPCYTYQDGSLTGVYAVLGGLTPLTKYYFKLTAANADGSSTGMTNSFMTSSTPPPAPMATTQDATDVTNTGATLNAKINAEGVPVVSCEFKYGTSTSYGQTAPCSPAPMSTNKDQAESATLTGLTEGTVYHYEIVFATKGGSTTGGDVTVIPGSQTKAKTGTATTGAATAITSTSATLGGTVDAGGQAGDSCSFLYGTANGFQGSVACSPSSIPTSGSQAETTMLTGLTPKTAYHFAIELITPAGTVDGKSVEFTTLAPPAPPSATTKPATLITAATARLNGAVNAEGETVVSCQFQYGRSPLLPGTTTAGSDKTASCLPTPSGAGSVSVRGPARGLSSAKTYHFRVVLHTQGGTFAGATLSFETAKVPGVKITGSRISRSHRTARFAFKATGVKATRFQCALVSLNKKGRPGRVRYRSCKSPKTYRHLAAKRYEFLVRAGNKAGWGPRKAKKFRI